MKYTKCMTEKMLHTYKIQLEKTTDRKQQYQLLKKLAALCYKMHLFHESRDYAEKALPYSINDTKKNQMILLHDYSEALYHLGLYDKAVDVCLKIEANFPKAPSMILAQTYLTLSGVYTSLQDYLTALAYIDKARKITNASKDTAIFLRIHNMYSIVYHAQGEYEKALQWLFDGLPIAKENKLEKTEAMFYNNIGHIYQALGNYKNSLNYFTRSLEIKRKDPTPYSLAVSLYNIGYVHLQMKNLNEANDTMETALSEALHSGDTAILELIYRDFSIICEKRKELKKAYEYYKRYYDLHLQTFANEKTRKLTEMQNHYDIEKKEREKEIYRLKNIELASLYSKIEHHNRELTRINQSKDYILNIVSHDLKNSIGAIVSILDMMPQQNDPIYDKCMDMISNSANKSISLVQSILSASKIELDDFKLTLTPIVIQDFFNDHFEHFRLMANKKFIKLSISMPKQPIVCAIDIQRFWEIMSNLLSNAIKYTPQQGVVAITGKITTIKSQTYFSVLIKDSGIGIPQKYLNHVFEKFTSARRPGTDGEPTTGLGLSIVKRLVTLHNGSTKIRSEEGKGTTVIVKIPISSESFSLK